VLLKDGPAITAETEADPEGRYLLRLSGGSR
jgi:hypothetical protein